MPGRVKKLRTGAASRVDWNDLAARAERSRERAYAPYSGYRVGAAVVVELDTGETRVFEGANVENATYGLTICAERTAIAAAVAMGARRLRAIAIATQGPTAGSPCGMCRQVMREFAIDMPVALVVGGRVTERSTLKRLLPRAFGPEHLTPRPTPASAHARRSRGTLR